MELHILLADNGNIHSATKDTLHVHSIGEDEQEFIGIIDEFGDSIALRDGLTIEIEKFKKSFVDVATSVTFPSEPRIVFAVSDKDRPQEVMVDLSNKFKNNKKEFKPFKEVVQLNGNTLEFVPFMSSDRVYTEIKITNMDNSKNLYESLRFILTEIWKNLDYILSKVVDILTKFCRFILDSSLKNANQITDMLMLDIEIIKTKIYADNLRTKAGNLSSIENKYVWEDVDLRNQPLTSLHTIRLKGSTKEFGRYYILQTTPSGIEMNLSSAIIEVLCNKVIDYIQGPSKDNGIILLHDYLISSDIRVILRGGRKYRVFRTPNTTMAILTTDEVPTSVIDNLRQVGPSYRMTGELHIESEVYIKDNDKSYRINIHEL